MVSGHPELISEDFDILPKSITGDLPGLVTIKVGIPRCGACLLKPREFIARKPDSLLDKSEVLGQTLKTANKIDADFTLLIRDESVLRSEVSVCIFIAYRRYRHDEVSERHAWNEGVKPS